MKEIKKIIIASLVAGATLFHGADRLMATELNQEDGIFPWHSTEYVRTLNRNASTDADAAFYNPAGLAFMKATGLYINFSNSILHKKKMHTLDYYKITVEGTQNDLLHNNEHYDNFTDSDETATAYSSPDFHTNMPRGGIDDPTSRYVEIFSPVLPDINIIYKANSWAAFFSIGVMQAAPEVTFARGLATTDLGIMVVAEQFNAVANQTAGGSELLYVTWETNQIVRNEMFIAGTAGFAYRIMDALSASAALRYIHYTGGQKLEITGVRAGFDNDYKILGTSVGNIPQGLWDAREEDWDVETTYTGQSFGLILGTDFRPLKDLNIGVRYEYYLPAELKKKNVSFVVNPLIEATGQLDIFKDGSDNAAYTNTNGTSILKVTYPQSLSVGVSYNIFDSLRVEVDGDAYFKNQVDRDGWEDHYGIAYRVGGCVEYALSKQIVASLGYSYNNTGVKPEWRTEVDQLLFNHTVGTGVGIMVNDRLTMNLGLCYIYFVKAKVDSSMHTYTEIDVPVTIWGISTSSHITTDSTSYFTRELAEETMLVSFSATYRLGGGDSAQGGFVDDKDDDVKKKDKKTKKDKR